MEDPQRRFNQKNAKTIALGSRRWRSRESCTTSRSTIIRVVLPLAICSSICMSMIGASAGEAKNQLHVEFNPDGRNERVEMLPANHKMEADDKKPRTSLSEAKQPATGKQSSKATTKSNNRGRQSRQYEGGSLSTSGSGSYAAISGDGSTYVAQLPLTSANYASGVNPASSYASGGGDLGSPYSDPAGLSMARSTSGGYTTASGHLGPLIHHQAIGGFPNHPPPPPTGYFGPPVGGPISSIFSPAVGPLMNSMFPLAGRGFDVAEIVCSAIAVAIGAVIVGAPFILIYLFVMNQVNGNGPSLSSSGGSISLTGPSSSSNVGGRKKRHTSFPDSLMRQLSPFMNSEQFEHSFNTLVRSMSKHPIE